MEFLIATWQAGGATQVAIGLGRLLVQRGHRVRIFGPADLAVRIEAAGCVHRASPPEVEGGVMIAAAAVGLAGNLVSVWLLREGQSRSLTMRGAYLEVMGDLAGSVAVIVAGTFWFIQRVFFPGGIA